jgi:large subunit ribosomal protein L23
MHVYEVIKRPVMTEKSNIQADAHNRYTFEVDPRANKVQIADAVARVFSVNVVDVRVMNVRGKRRRLGRHTGWTAAWKKAVVTLAPGESIAFFEGV